MRRSPVTAIWRPLLLLVWPGVSRVPQWWGGPQWRLSGGRGYYLSDLVCPGCPNDEEVPSDGYLEAVTTTCLTWCVPGAQWWGGPQWRLSGGRGYYLSDLVCPGSPNDEEVPSDGYLEAVAEAAHYTDTGLGSSASSSIVHNLHQLLTGWESFTKSTLTVYWYV